MSEAMKMTKPVAALMAGLLVLGAVQAANDAGDPRDARSLNKTIVIDDGGRAEDLKTVNGSIRIGNAAEVRSAQTVNGSVKLGSDGRAGSLETVNGEVIVGSRGVVSGDIATVNGRLEVAEYGSVSGKATTVNGSVTLRSRAQVGSIETLLGNVTLEDNSRVEGGILVKRPRSGSVQWSRVPVVTIGQGAEVRGELVFEHEVKLRVHNTARIGAVKGAQVERFQ